MNDIYLFLGGVACGMMGAIPFAVAWVIASRKAEAWRELAYHNYQQAERSHRSCHQLLAAFDTMKNLYFEKLCKEWEMEKEEPDSADWWKS